jgi:hypothetical protein
LALALYFVRVSLLRRSRSRPGENADTRRASTFVRLRADALRRDSGGQAHSCTSLLTKRHALVSICVLARTI